MTKAQGLCYVRALHIRHKKKTSEKRSLRGGSGVERCNQHEPGFSTGLSRKNVCLAGVPGGGESDISARHQRRAEEECPSIETIVQYKPAARRRAHVAQMNSLPADGYNIVGINRPTSCCSPWSQVQYKTVTSAGLLVSLHLTRLWCLN